MSGNVKTVPEMTSLQATTLCLVAFHVAAPVSVFNNVKQIRPTVPKDCCDDQPWNMMLEELLQITTAQGEVREVQERRREEQSPEPADFDKVNVEEIVRAREIRFRKWYEV